MEYMIKEWNPGFAVIVSVVIIAVLIYTIVKVRKQARNVELLKRKSEERYSAKQQNEASDTDVGKEENK